MKKLMFALAVAVATVAMAENDELAAEGGMLTIWPKDPGTFLFVNTQIRIDEKLIKDPVNSLAQEFFVDIRCVNEKLASFDLRKAPEEKKRLAAKGVIWIVDDPTLPVCMTAPEDNWGLLNVAPLLADSAKDKKLAQRVLKYIHRVFCNMHGGSDSVMMPACVMQQAVDIAGVDALQCHGYSPEAHSKVSNYLNRLGYKHCHQGTYLEACESGWAPEPTNAVQKAIWSKVHAMPTAPIKIKPGDKPKMNGK